jgi:hypothetical protein
VSSGFLAILPVIAGACAVGGLVAFKRHPSAESTAPSAQALLGRTPPSALSARSSGM